MSMYLLILLLGRALNHTHHRAHLDELDDGAVWVFEADEAGGATQPIGHGAGALGDEGDAVFFEPLDVSVEVRRPQRQAGEAWTKQVVIRRPRVSRRLPFEKIDDGAIFVGHESAPDDVSFGTDGCGDVTVGCLVDVHQVFEAELLVKGFGPFEVADVEVDVQDTCGMQALWVERWRQGGGDQADDDDEEAQRHAKSGAEENLLHGRTPCLPVGGGG